MSPRNQTEIIRLNGRPWKTFSEIRGEIKSVRGQPSDLDVARAGLRSSLSSYTLEDPAE